MDLVVRVPGSGPTVRSGRVESGRGATDPLGLITYVSPFRIYIWVRCLKSVDLHFSHASPLDGETRFCLLFGKTIFKKMVLESPLILVFF